MTFNGKMYYFPLGTSLFVSNVNCSNSPKWLTEPGKDESDTSKQMDRFLIKSKFILYLSLPERKMGDSIYFDPAVNP